MERDVVDEAVGLLAAVDSDLPLRVNFITNPDEDAALATIRKVDGYPLVMPHPESQSILSAPRDVFLFIEQAPGIIQRLVDEVESLRNANPDR